MRFIALDVHRDSCGVAIKDEAGLRLAGRVKSLAGGARAVSAEPFPG